jgi:hypothetical protein
MTRNQYRQELERYKLTQQAAGKLFGDVQKRAAARWATAEGAVPHSVALALALMKVCGLMPDDLGDLPKKFWGRNPKAKEDKVDTLRGKIRQALGPLRLTESEEDVNLQEPLARSHPQTDSEPLTSSHPKAQSATRDWNEPQQGEADLAHDDARTEGDHPAADEDIREDSNRQPATERGLFAGF